MDTIAGNISFFNEVSYIIKNENNKKVPIHINHFNTGKEDKNE